MSASAAGDAMESGVVVKWVEDRGYGFIAPEFGGDDIFLHRKAFEGPVTLAVGDRVEFRAGVRRTGAFAVEAVLCSEVN